MDSFEKWRREVNIILNDTVGYSLADLDEYIDTNIRLMFENGDDPLDGAQYAVNEVDPSLDIEDMLNSRLIPKLKPKEKKNSKKFRIQEE